MDAFTGHMGNYPNQIKSTKHLNVHRHESDINLIVERQAFFKLSSQTHTKYSCHIIRMVGVNVIVN